MSPSAQAPSMPPPIPVPAFLSSDEPVHPANGERVSPSEPVNGPDAVQDEEKKPPRPPEPKPGPGGIKRSKPGTTAVKRKITWVDDHGAAIAQVKEFEPSDSDDSEEEDGDEESQQSCSCVIQ